MFSGFFRQILRHQPYSLKFSGINLICLYFFDYAVKPKKSSAFFAFSFFNNKKDLADPGQKMDKTNFLFNTCFKRDLVVFTGKNIYNYFDSQHSNFPDVLFG